MHLKNFGGHVAVRPSVRPSAPQGNQCQMSRFLTDMRSCNLCLMIHTLISWSIDSCQNKVSADQNHMTVSFAQVPTSSRTCVPFKFSADQFSAFNWSQSQTHVFFSLFSKVIWSFAKVEYRYRKIPKISPGAYIFQKPFLRGLFLEGLIFGGAYLRREVCVSKSIGLAL